MPALVIHSPQRLDRASHVGALHSLIPALQLLSAQVPSWIQDPHNRALTGCTLSHLQAVRIGSRTPDENLLVFEDDAVLDAEGWQQWQTAKRILPQDAGIILLGAETEAHGEDLGPFVEVLPKFFGSHAVVYTPALLRSNFLLEAYAIAASHPIGKHEGHNALCPESILLMATLAVGLKVYRPRRMAFTAAEGYSSRESAVVPARTANLQLDLPAPKNHV